MIKLKQNLLLSILQVLTCALLAFGAAGLACADTAAKVDPSGTWEWSIQGRNGAPGRTNTLVLKLEGDKLTGTLTTPARNRNVETKIEEATFKGDEITFSVTHEFRNNKITTQYSGKVTADTIKGKIEFKNRNGETRSHNWTATKKK